MSALNLRVELANDHSTSELLSLALLRKKEYLTVMLCLRAIGIVLPRDIRRKLVVLCSSPVLSRFTCHQPDSPEQFTVINQWWEFYMSNPALQEYNPLLCVSRKKWTDVAIIFHSIIKNRFLDSFSFFHPYISYVRSSKFLTFQYEKILTHGFTYTNGEYIHTAHIERRAECIVGFEHHDQMLSAHVWSIHHNDDAPFVNIYRCDLKSSLPIRKFDIPLSDSLEEKTAIENIISCYVPKPPIVHGLTRIFQVDEYFRPIHLRIRSRIPLDYVTILCGYLSEPMIRPKK